MERCGIVCRKYRQVKTPHKPHLSPLSGGDSCGQPFLLSDSQCVGPTLPQIPSHCYSLCLLLASSLDPCSKTDIFSSVAVHFYFSADEFQVLC